MAKHYINLEGEVKGLAEQNKFGAGDIIVHKPFTFAEITGLLKSEYDNIDLVPVSPGTESYTINGYNTSVIKIIGTPKNLNNE